jgi:hypothetical protein
MTTIDRDVLTELERAFAALTSSVPSTPTCSWSEVISSAGAEDRAQSIALDHGAIGHTDKKLPATHSETKQIGRVWTRKRVLMLTAAAACVVVAGVVVPLATSQVKPAAAALLDAAARSASEHGVLTPGPNQSLEDSYNLSIRATEYDGSSGLPTSTATFRGEIQEWTLQNGSGHEQVTYGTPQFPSAADAGAWSYGHSVPLMGSIPYTARAPVVSMGPAIGAFDVETLPTDPSQLALVLEGSSTGVPGLDGIVGPDVVFHRVALLLSTPLLGSSPAFESALYRVLASIPNIESLGPMADHSGRSGQGFAVPNSSFSLIVDTSTGALLEMFESPSSSAPTTPGGAAIGTETLQWLDPVGEQVIPASFVPAPTAP